MARMQVLDWHREPGAEDQNMRATSLVIAAGAALLAGGPLRAQTAAPDVPPAATQDTAPPAATQDAAPPAATQNAAPPPATGRFIFSRVDGGILRLDSLSGQVTLCSQHSTGWACQAVPETRALAASSMEAACFLMRVTFQMPAIRPSASIRKLVRTSPT